MIGLLDFEGGEKKKEEKGNEGEVRQELSFFLFFFGLSMDTFGNSDTLPCVCFFYLLFFFL